MSAKTLMVNEGLLQEMEQRIATLRSTSKRLVQRRDDAKFSYAEGIELMGEYDDAAEVLQEIAGQLFAAVDLQDPEDGELQRRDEEEGEEDEEEGEDEDEDGEDDE